MRTLTALLMLCMLVASTATSGGNDDRHEGTCALFIGANSLDLDKMSDSFEDHDLPRLENNTFFIGGGCYGFVGGGLMLGGSGGVFWQEEEKNGTTVKYSGAYGFFDIGYELYSVGDLKIYPLIGLGGGGGELELTTDEGPIDWNEFLDDPRGNTKLGFGSLAAKVGLGLHYFMPVKETEEETKGVVIGARIGYIFASDTPEWSLGDTEIRNSPSGGFGGPYFRILIGGGSR